MNITDTKAIIKILEKNGWIKDRKSGSHATFTKTGEQNIITIPVGKKELCRPMIKRLLKEAKIGVDMLRS